MPSDVQNIRFGGDHIEWLVAKGLMALLQG